MLEGASLGFLGGGLFHGLGRIATAAGAGRYLASATRAVKADALAALSEFNESLAAVREVASDVGERIRRGVSAANAEFAPGLRARMNTAGMNGGSAWSDAAKAVGRGVKAAVGDASDAASVQGVERAGVGPGQVAGKEPIPVAGGPGKAPAHSAYSVAYETELRPSSYPGARAQKSAVYDAHFREANENLLDAMRSDADFARGIRSMGIDVESPGFDMTTSPAGWTWHHAQQPGIMHLVPRPQHQFGSPFWNALHPNGMGGMAIWGIQ